MTTGLRSWLDEKPVAGHDAQGRVTGCNLDIKNPHSGEVADHRAPTEIVDAIIAQEKRILGIMDEIKSALAELA
jgi:type I restriction enzyme M protein